MAQAKKSDIHNEPINRAAIPSAPHFLPATFVRAIHEHIFLDSSHKERDTHAFAFTYIVRLYTWTPDILTLYLLLSHSLSNIRTHMPSSVSQSVSLSANAQYWGPTTILPTPSKILDRCLPLVGDCWRVSRYEKAMSSIR